MQPSVRFHDRKKVGFCLWMISYQSKKLGIVSPLTKQLMEKDPMGRSVHPDILLPPGVDSSHDSILFDQITNEATKQAAFRMHGAAGPSGVDALLWRRLCSSFKSASNDLCNALAAVACTTLVYPDGLSAFVPCRLIFH